MVVLQQSDDCEFDTSLLREEGELKRCILEPTDESVDGDEFLNMAYVGYVVHNGVSRGIVVATGNHTLLATRIKQGTWPPG